LSAAVTFAASFMPFSFLFSMPHIIPYRREGVA